MDLTTLKGIFAEHNCQKVYIKTLSANDNSKNQVYLGGSFEVLNILPIQSIVADDSGDWEKTRFKSKIDFSWIDNEGLVKPAPEAQLILYPKYPEVRFSGFLKHAENAPSDLMANRIPGRLLFLGITKERKIIGYVVAPYSSIANEVNAIDELEEVGVFKELPISMGNGITDTKQDLLDQLKRIHNLGWIDAKRLDKNGIIVPCETSQCGGYTLEAEFDIRPNGYSEPDYLGWELKQFSVKDFSKFRSEVVTLMTPEPTDGFYVSSGVEPFIRKYGYNDKLGREARMNFGGIHKYDEVHPTTSLKLVLEGYDVANKKIRNAAGFMGLVDPAGEVAASWSFSSLIKHWNTKHANACYVPSMNRKDSEKFQFSKQQYCYGNNILLGRATDFSLFLSEVSKGHIYYDPGIKLELAIEGVRKQAIKRRSQFRIKSGNLINLYKSNEIVNLEKS